MERNKNWCEQCGMTKYYHLHTWTEGLLERLSLTRLFSFIPNTYSVVFDRYIELVFIWLRLLRPVKNFAIKDINVRSAFFVEEARRKNYDVSVLKTPFAYTNFFILTKNKKTYSLEGLPNASHVSTRSVHLMDDKDFVKKELTKNGIPVPEGKYFSLLSIRKAVTYGNQLGYPLVVKPRYGSFARHITINIKSEEELRRAIKTVLAFSPAFIVERYLARTWVVRATVVDFKNIALAKRIQPNVTGDGVHTIRDLITLKNAEARRGDSDDISSVVYKIVIDDAVAIFLKKNGKTLDSIPHEGELVYLREEPFVRYGADIENVTSRAHPDNLELFKTIAKIFSARLVGIDFMCEDITRSYKDQTCGVLELNSLPCVEIHHEPTIGEPVNVSRWLLDMMEAYY